jgi:ABC-2 type transport system ATP-binding protein
MIEVSGLTRYYGVHAAVKDLSFTIRDHEIVGILGLNGAGKSTTLKILAGLLLPSSGAVSIDGVDVVQAPDSLRANIGFLPEDTPLYRDMRVREFVSYIGQIKGMSQADAEGRVDAVLKRCGLEERALQVISELSHGYRKRVGIAQAIIHDPKLVILDEPISGLDPAQIRDIRQLIRGLKDTCTVLISSHNLPEISATCDRLLVLNEGQLVAEGTEDELAARSGSGVRLELSVRGAEDAVLAHIGTLANAGAVRVSDANEGVVHFSVQLSDDDRESVIASLVQAGFGIRKVEEADSELEDIFVNITSGGPQ